LVLSGVYATHSDWMQVELDLAAALGKPVIGLYPWGSQRASRVVQDAAIGMANWSTVSIVDAVRQYAL